MRREFRIHVVSGFARARKYGFEECTATDTTAPLWAAQCGLRVQTKSFELSSTRQPAVCTNEHLFRRKIRNQKQAAVVALAIGRPSACDDLPRTSLGKSDAF